MHVIIRELLEFSELHAAEALQRAVWQVDDLDISNAGEMAAVRESGGTLLGAFAGDELIGFVFGFVGFEENEVTIHSHLAAVKKQWRSQQIGYKLKLAQREQALNKGIRRITWTFEPLQNLNAHFNFARLGVTATKYKVNFYGAETAILVPGIGTDRFWVNWQLDSERVQKKITGETQNDSDAVNDAIALVEADHSGTPRLNNELDKLLASNVETFTVEIPRDIAAFQQVNPPTAIAWRETTRAALTMALHAGFTVTDFIRFAGETPRGGRYVLQRVY